MFQNSMLVSMIPFCTAKEVVGRGSHCVLAMAVGMWMESVSLGLEAVAEVQAGMVGCQWVLSRVAVTEQASRRVSMVAFSVCCWML